MSKWNIGVSRDDTAAVKGIAVMLMLVHHVFAFPYRLVNGASYEPMIPMSDGTSVIWHLALLGKVCVAMFTVMAGFGIYRGFSKQLQSCGDGDKTEAYLSFIFRRLKKLYFKVWPVFLVFIPMGLYLKCPFITKDLASWVKNALLIDSTFNAEWWFLTSYLILVLMSPMVMAFFSRKRSSLYADIVLITILAVFTERVLLHVVLTWDKLIYLRASFIWIKMSPTLILLPMFMLGAWMAKYEIMERIMARFEGKNVARVLTGFVFILLPLILRDGWVQSNVWGFDQFDALYGASLCLGIVMVTCRQNVLKKPLLVIGNQSTGIWLIHSFFCFYYFQQFSYAPKKSVLVFLLVLGMSFACAWIIDFCASFIVNKIKGAKKAA
ncbi:acyltransferase [Fibrobacter sp. UWEL]|uniref:acyltransferase family protein n=1 Tax=Fibrobacter sp. UWEL TaxID=1896209 RepID=UPI000914D303|nr:acyltransferase [Fibrobacter sp. UWEL]SHL02083.1 Peptidoglycan/LPS O-acetylase OafA/YrhL, contains acyltransferase and SGNH-hydrolase domains [Fibrobacter sp. UWEL]